MGRHIVHAAERTRGGAVGASPRASAQQRKRLAAARNYRCSQLPYGLPPARGFDAGWREVHLRGRSGHAKSLELAMASRFTVVLRIVHKPCDDHPCLPGCLGWLRRRLQTRLAYRRLGAVFHGSLLCPARNLRRTSWTRPPAMADAETALDIVCYMFCAIYGAFFIWSVVRLLLLQRAYPQWTQQKLFHLLSCGIGGGALGPWLRRAEPQSRGAEGSMLPYSIHVGDLALSP